jgi:hypothetical protein
VLGVEDDEIKTREREKLRDARRRPGQETPEKRLSPEDPLPERSEETGSVSQTLLNEFWIGPG